MLETQPLFFFDRKTLWPKAEALHAAYLAAVPFPHVVMDDFLPENAAGEILEEFPGPSSIEWSKYMHQHSKKLATDNEALMGERTRHLITELNSLSFITFLEKLSGIQGLISDPHLWGGGLHQIARGGHLDIHADFNRHEKLKLDRRLNLLLYLNKDWKEEYGGHLELWGRSMKRCEQKILPVFNRCVIFSTTDFSYHGHPEPLRCPEGMSRKSLALYYYSNGRPASEISGSHNTLYRNTPSQQVGQKTPFWKRLFGG